MESGERDDGRVEALKAARRIYDRQVTELDNIDDKAMRTVRTSVIILGFVAAGLTAAGPDAASELHRIPVTVGILGTAAVFVTTFLGIGIYTVTEYPYEIEPLDIEAAKFTPEADWIDAATDRVNTASEDLEREIDQNARYLEYSQFSLLVGALCLVTASGMAILHQSFGISPRIQTITVIFASVSVITVAKHKDLSL